MNLKNIILSTKEKLDPYSLISFKHEKPHRTQHMMALNAPLCENIKYKQKCYISISRKGERNRVGEILPFKEEKK